MATKELRTASRVIADRHMVPAYRKAALKVPTWGDYLAEVGAIQKRPASLSQDRIPKESPHWRGIHQHAQISRQAQARAGGSRDLTGVNPFEKTNWIGKAKTYTKPALTEWGEAVDRVVRKWNGNVMAADRQNPHRISSRRPQKV